jgi:solute carrier family 35 protein F1/2
MLADASDWRQHSVQSSYPNKIIGDIYAASGAIMMGVIHIYSQVLVSETGPMEYLGIVGFFAWPIALIASLIFERKENAYVVHGSTCSTGLSSILLAMSVVTKSLDTAGTASFLYISEATLLNLSLLTTDLWSATFSVIVEGLLPSPLSWVALVVVFFGIFLYEMGPSPGTLCKK